MSDTIHSPRRRATKKVANIELTASGQVVDVLTQLFSGPDLCQWIQSEFGEAVRSDLPGDQTPVRTLAHEAWAALTRHGFLTAEFFVSLVRVRPAQVVRIHQVADEIFPADHQLLPNDELIVQLEEIYKKREEERIQGRESSILNQQIALLKRAIRDGPQLSEGAYLDDGRYRLITKLGSGGFGTVWKSWERIGAGQGRFVALKVLHPHIASDSNNASRFTRGANRMAQLDHRGVVRAFPAGIEDSGYRYFPMEFMVGGDLHAALLGKRISKGQAIQCIVDMADALSHIHDRGLIHRDVKPNNILLDADMKAKLGDFDLVYADDTTGGTRTGALGALVYSAPELLHSPHKADSRADIYSLGMTLLFCLLGEMVPIDAMRNAQDFVDDLDAAPELKGVLLGAVDWDRDARYETAQAMKAALQAALRKIAASEQAALEKQQARAAAVLQQQKRWDEQQRKQGEMLARRALKIKAPVHTGIRLLQSLDRELSAKRPYLDQSDRFRRLHSALQVHSEGAHLPVKVRCAAVLIFCPDLRLPDIERMARRSKSLAQVFSQVVVDDLVVAEMAARSMPPQRRKHA